MSEEANPPTTGVPDPIPETATDGVPDPIQAVAPAAVPYIYIGPNSPKLGIYSLHIYPELPPQVIEAISAQPALQKLFPTLDQWRGLKPQVINSQGNVTYVAGTKHAVEHLTKMGVF